MGVGMVGELEKQPAGILVHSALFTTEGIYFMGFLVSHWGADRKYLLPERKSLKL